MLNIVVMQSGNYLNFLIEDNGIGRVNAGTFKKQTAGNYYSSKGIEITVKRLLAFNKSNFNPVDYQDLADENGNPAGTRVTISIKRYSL